tara:strand:- start:318 stop:455 length:138 start_codon:yes stop_codon:yes gene_type:complete
MLLLTDFFFKFFVIKPEAPDLRTSIDLLSLDSDVNIITGISVLFF